MKKKIIITVILVVVLALGSTLVLAAVDEDGNVVNPFAKILSGKVEDGIITREDADTFTRVWDTIKDETREFGKTGRKGMSKDKRPDACAEINPEFMEEYKAVHSAMTEEIINGLIADGVIDAGAAGEDGFAIGIYLKDADEETRETVKEAFSVVMDEMKEFLDSKVADGTITQDEADRMTKMGGPRSNFRSDMKRGPGRREAGSEDDSD